ncbi:SusD/RagB family nutrient-binding outer membrane lipoprotein [Mucilaginibacter sp. UYCu711]|uniref:SusD/RagB family nutrient-binding outer membrane lipoprotein n=1 Tax=Mucilaginibacter sp. UYCu711 TaxID=3156339 RepID=UPI003D1EE5EC
MKKILIPIFTVALLFGTSCKKQFFDINNSPNSPTEASITPKVLLPRILHTLGLRVGNGFDYSALWMGYWSRSGSFGQSIEPESYNITTTYQAAQWTNWYDLLTDVNLMEKQAVALKLPFYVGVAKTIKAMGFMYLVDQYNNVPYSKAFDFTNSVSPAYDKGEDIYADLFVQLEAGAKAFKDADAAATAAGGVDAETQGADIMFGTLGYNKGVSEITLWRKLLNTQRLKLLIHESQVVNPTTVTTVTGQITADGSGFLGAGQNALVNPGYVVVDTKQNPFWNSYKVSALGVLDTYNRANIYILTKYAGPDNKLAANNLTTTAGQALAATQAVDDDIRYQFVFSKAATPMTGSTPYQGALTGAPIYNYIGTNWGEVVPNSDPYRAVNQSDVAGPGLAKAPTQSQAVLTATESLFLQAEAAQRGWITADPATLYKTAVEQSFVYLTATANGLSATATADAYLAGPNPTANYVAATDKIKFLVMAKYLSLIGLDNFEAYVDYRRLGVPTDLPLSLNANRLTNVIPLRLQYPKAEYDVNTAAVGAQGTINPQTSTIFWDK